MKTSTKATLAAVGTTVVITGGLIWNKLDSWINPQPDGPGSGDELPADWQDGPGSGDELPRGEPTGPGSGDELPADWQDGPGSGDELPRAEPTGPGSGDELPADWQDGPGSGDELPRAEPTGPGSGDELPPGEPVPNWPDGPGSGDELPRAEPTGPGSGDELPPDWKDNPGSDDIITFADTARGSCSLIEQASTCVEYQGSYWNSNTGKLACSGGVYSSQACPRPAVGGCRMNPESAQEMITWHYNYGGDPFDGEVVGYAASACNANPATIWIVIN